MSNLKKSAKWDRNRKSGQNGAYKMELRHEKSHVRRIKKHVKRYGVSDKAATDALMRYAIKLGLNATNSAKEFLKQAT